MNLNGSLSGETMTGQVIEKELDSELMLYNAEQDAVHVLNPVARRVYELYKKGISTDEMAESIQHEFRVTPGTDIRTDIQGCLAELTEKGLV